MWVPGRGLLKTGSAWCLFRADMDFEEINRFLELMRQYGLAELELERDGLRLRARKAENDMSSAPKHQLPIKPKAGREPSSLGGGLAFVGALARLLPWDCRPGATSSTKR